MNKEQFLHCLKFSRFFLYIALTYFMGTGAFSRGSNEVIKKHGECRVCHKKFRGKKKKKQLEGSHYNHSREDVDGKDYDDPARGGPMCRKCHYQFHAEHVGQANNLGITEQNNLKALYAMYERLSETEKKNVTSPDYIKGLIITKMAEHRTKC